MQSSQHTRTRQQIVRYAQCDRIGLFLLLAVFTNFIAKVAQILGIFGKCHDLWKTAVSSFLAAFVKNWATFKFNHLVTLVQPGRYSSSVTRFVKISIWKNAIFFGNFWRVDFIFSEIIYYLTCNLFLCKFCANLHCC